MQRSLILAPAPSTSTDLAPAALAVVTFALAMGGLRYGRPALIAAFGQDSLWASDPLVKVGCFVVLPLLALAASPALRRAAGLRFRRVGASLRLVARTGAVVLPACAAFALVAMLGWGIGEWRGAGLLAGVFAVAFALVVRLTAKLPSGAEQLRGGMTSFVALASAALVVGVVLGFGESLPPVLRRLLYFPLVVAVGEELLFRGVVQSGLNAALGRPYELGGVRFGVGLPAAALLFGLAHAIAPVPAVWPWMAFATVGGLILGYVREKDGSLLAPICVHALMDAPLILVG